jgi:acetyltransferase-like isoleucine patch superfamily enzyme
MKRIYKKIILKYYQKIRIAIFKHLSNNKKISGNPLIVQPVSFFGMGVIEFGQNVQLGYFPSPFFYDGSIHLEARNENSKINIGNNVMINNNLKIICDKTNITIGDDVLIGYGVNIFDSDFHEIDPQSRKSGNYLTAEVHIGSNVFIGSNVSILKGVTIGKNTVIAYGSVVTKSFPDNVIIGGNPAKIISQILSDENK